MIEMQVMDRLKNEAGLEMIGQQMIEMRMTDQQVIEMQVMNPW
jgi:hypothetical protein